MTITEAEALLADIPERRVAHCRRVADLAAEFAPRWQAAADEARLAGLLHDLCRDWNPSELLADAQRLGIKPSPLERAHPRQLLHGPVASGELAGRDLPPTVLAAIASHTAGAAGMGPVARCVYLADFCEPGREFAAAARARELAATSLDEALAFAVRSTLEDLIAHDRGLAQGTVDLYNEIHER
ncbi:MAG: bis(5'-nucleosyl)-tetraphosphatase (symmetrical) YqeK [Thermoleophilia bacterium]